MANTLGLDDDLDGVELVQNVEKAFDIEIANDEAERILVVGELYDLLLRKIPTNDTDKKCASAMTFYRLRRSVRSIDVEHKFAPSSDISFLEVQGVKASFKKIEKETGLRLPNSSLMWVGIAGCFAIVLSVCIAIGLLAVFHRPVWSWAMAFCGFVFLAGYVFIWADPGKLPKGCKTLGGLTKKTAPLNFGLLMKSGAIHRDADVWSNLLDLLSDYTLPRSEINRDTFFLASQLRK